MINKQDLVIGTTYYTFYMDSTNAGDKLRDVIKVFNTTVVDIKPGTINPINFSVPTTVLLKLNSKFRRYLYNYMNHAMDYYSSIEEAKDAFDSEILDILDAVIENGKVDDSIRLHMYKKMYDQTRYMGLVKHLTTVNKYVAVLIKDTADFLKFGKDNFPNTTDIIYKEWSGPRQVRVGNTLYIGIRYAIENILEYGYDAVIETEFAKDNPYYVEIKAGLKLKS